MPTPCPQCSRPNGPHRDRCLYCGAEIRTHGVEVDGEADEAAIGEAVFSALSGPGETKRPRGLSEDSFDAPEAEGLRHEEEPQPVSLAGQLLDSVQAQVAVEAASLPLGRRPWVLVVSGEGREELGAEITAITGLDHVTARMVARSEWDRPLLWGVEREGLDAIAQRLKTELNLAATVVETARLSDITAPLCVLGADWEGQFLCTEKPLWMGHGGIEEDGDLQPFGSIRMAVPGQVAIRRFQDVRRSKWGRNKGSNERREIGERRVVLLDLHTDETIYRVVLGVTDFKNLPGHHPGSGPLSIKGLEEALPGLFEGVHIQGRRVCHPQGARAMQDTETTRTRFELSGWSNWEEHTRLCRVHRGLG